MTTGATEPSTRGSSSSGVRATLRTRIHLPAATSFAARSRLEMLPKESTEVEGEGEVAEEEGAGVEEAGGHQQY